jgi:uroporphyrinogen decarboxylase
LNGQIPLIMTIFSPLTLAYKLAGINMLDHLRRHPTALRSGLRTLTDTTARFAQAALATGADGIFFATQLASHRWLTPDEYEQFGVPYDSLVLEAVAARSWITVLHLHGQDVFFALADRFPIHAVSWHDRETRPSLGEARQRTQRTLMAGLDRNLLERGPTTAIQAQVREAISQTKGRSLILAPSCVVPTTAPAEHLRAVVRAL